MVFAICAALGTSTVAQETLRIGVEIWGSVAAGEMARYALQTPAGYLVEGVVDRAMPHDSGDRFQSRGVVAQFERAADGRIIAFTLATSRTYAVRFERLD
jgi:hypothetical protein